MPLIKREQRPLRPAVTFGQQRHRQEDRHGGGRKSDAHDHIAVLAETPLQRRPRIVEARKVRRAFRPGRQGRPLCPSLFQPAPVVGRVTYRQVGGLGRVYADVEGVSTRRVEQPVTHHRADRAGGHHRLGDEAVDCAKHDRSIEGSACDDVQSRIEREMSDENGESAKHRTLHIG